MKTRLSPPLTPDEAAALSVAMAEALMARLSGFGSPPAGFGSPPAGFGSPPADLGSPPAGFGSPPAGFGSPPAGFGSPPAGFGVPPRGTGSPSAGFGSPPAAEGSTEPAAIETSGAADTPPNPKGLAAPLRQLVDLELRYSGEPPRRADADSEAPRLPAPDAGAGESRSQHRPFRTVEAPLPPAAGAGAGAGPIPPGGSAAAVPPSPSKGRRGSGGITVPPGWSAVPQGGGDLGDRLARAAAAAASAGVEHLVIVGADAPLLPLSLVDGAFTALRDRPIALAPAEDGGFVLLGLATGRLSPAAVASVLREVPWGAAEVLEATRRNAAAARLEVALLPSSWDVDRPDDLTRLRRAVAALPPADRPRRLRALLAGVPVGTRPAAGEAPEHR